MTREERNAIIEECAKVADAQSEWADRMIDKHRASPSHFGTIGNTANDIAESIRDLKTPKVRTSHHRNKEAAARLQALVNEKYAK